MHNYYIAVDIGGTQLRAATYLNGSNEPVRQKKIATQGDEAAIDRLIGLIKDVWPENGRLVSIGAAAPGALDPETGIMYKAANIPGWINFPLGRILREQFNVPVLLGNDANLAALAEWQFGAGKGHHHIIYMTISTGIGGGIIVDDRLLIGQHGLAAEIGHVTVMPDGPVCGCGGRGHLEAVASGTAIAAYAAEQIASGRPSSMRGITPLTARDVTQAAENGDPLSIEVLARAGSFLGVAIADLLHNFNPSIVILGGGVTRSGRLVLDPLYAELPKRVISPHYLDDLVITTAALGDDVGLLGALVLARRVKS